MVKQTWDFDWSKLNYTTPIDKIKAVGAPDVPQRIFDAQQKYEDSMRSTSVASSPRYWHCSSSSSQRSAQRHSCTIYPTASTRSLSLIGQKMLKLARSGLCLLTHPQPRSSASRTSTWAAVAPSYPSHPLRLTIGGVRFARTALSFSWTPMGKSCTSCGKHSLVPCRLPVNRRLITSAGAFGRMSSQNPHHYPNLRANSPTNLARTALSV